MENKMTLYALTGQMADIEAMLEETGGELTPEIEAQWAETRESLLQKVDNYNALIQKLKAYSENIKAEQDRLAKLKKTADNSLKRIKDHVKATMEQFGLKSIEGNLCKMSLSSSTATEVDEETILAPYRVYIEMLEAKLPPYITVEPSISKSGIKEATKELPEGVTLPGVTFKKNTNLTIK
jgi:hypothetical protein